MDLQNSLVGAIDSKSLPNSIGTLFGEFFDESAVRFLIQESALLDFKESNPTHFGSGFGAGIIRLCGAFYNTYGGIIVFGVHDHDFGVVRGLPPLDVEAINRALSDYFGQQIECILRRYEVGDDRFVNVLIVPKRAGQRPARLVQPLDKYPVGTLWVRDRHEVLEARTRHLKALYSDRTELSAPSIGARLHKSLPPPPSTIEEFIGRYELLDQLWDWLVFGSQPRLYLHGPGGSGKSTLAYEFALAVATSASAVTPPHAPPLDYVVFLSAKETAFDPLSQKEKLFSLRDFSDSRQQFAQILVHAGLLTTEAASSASEGEIEEGIDELFRNFSGLIVIDDIDALTRRNHDTGEEQLFLKIAQARSRTKVLYTLRYAPPYAVNTSKEVPSLKFETEYFPFAEACSRQFGVPAPSGGSSVSLYEESAGLPLIIETIVGLRRTSSSYDDAIRSYQSREGDAARRYLYQREYDRLEAKGKSRLVLAALALVGAPIPFTAIADITSLSTTQVRDSISETRGIFLRTSETESGDTLYEVSTPSESFLLQASKSLSFYPALERAVEFFTREAARVDPGEAAMLFRFSQFARTGDVARIAEEAESIPYDSPIRANPRFLGLLGQGYASLGASRAEDARECFRRAFTLHNRDQYMLRTWYRIEYVDLRNPSNAEALCRQVLESKGLPTRIRSEFHSKLGQCLGEMARGHVFTNLDRAISLNAQSLQSYIEGAWLSRRSIAHDDGVQSAWLTEAAARLFRLLGDNVEPLFDVIDHAASQGHDVDLESMRILMEPLRRAAPVVGSYEQAKISGLARRLMGKISRNCRQFLNEEGFSYLMITLDQLTRRPTGEDGAQPDI